MRRKCLFLMYRAIKTRIGSFWPRYQYYNNFVFIRFFFCFCINKLFMRLKCSFLVKPPYFYLPHIFLSYVPEKAIIWKFTRQKFHVFIYYFFTFFFIGKCNMVGSFAFFFILLQYISMQFSGKIDSNQINFSCLITCSWGTFMIEEEEVE